MPKKADISVADFERICEHYETSIDGFQTSAEKCGIKGSTAYDHKDDEQYGGRYARAHEKKKFWLFEQLHEIQSAIPPVDERGRTDNGWVTWQKNRVDLLKWTLAKLFPKDFGEKIEIEQTNFDGGKAIIKIGDGDGNTSITEEV